MLNFTKMQAYGNDYIYIDARFLELNNIGALARRLSDRHLGIGSDGLVLICKSDIADFKMRIFNPDGTEAQMCGNAIRSVGKYVYEKGLTEKLEILVESLGGIKKLKIIVDEEKKVKLVITNLGVPNFDVKAIPVLSNKEKFLKESVQVLDKTLEVSALSFGNPHCVVIVDNVDTFLVEKYGPELENNYIFPEKTNVTFVEVIDSKRLKIREWERGAGETLACATGSAAALLITYLLGLTSNKCIVEQKGGELEVLFDEDSKEVLVYGNSEFVFEGSIDIGGI